MTRTKTIALADARKDLDALVVDASSGSVVVLEEDGSPVVAIIPGDEYASYLRLTSKRERLYAVLDAGCAAFADVPADEVEREIDETLRRVRRESGSDQQPK